MIKTVPSVGDVEVPQNCSYPGKVGTKTEELRLWGTAQPWSVLGR